MNQHQIAFIFCVNNELYFNEACQYIERLHIPDGYSIDIIAVREAESMCAAYNAAMKSSEAKYKIYLHQDVFIRNHFFLDKILEIFINNDTVGMIGMIGGNGMPESGVVFRAWNEGVVDVREPDMAYFMLTNVDYEDNVTVEAVDGLLIATQYDIPWREDLFHEFDFYDASHSFEMRKRGYQLVVPYQQIPWVIHDSSFAKLNNYDKNRKLCIKEYPKYLYAKDGFRFSYDAEWEQKGNQWEDTIKKSINLHDWTSVRRILNEYRQQSKKSSRLEMYSLWYEIYEKEKNRGKHIFIIDSDSEDLIYQKYIRLRFLLRRLELEWEGTELTIQEMILKGNLSLEACIVMTLHSIIEKKKVFQLLECIFKNVGNETDVKQLIMIIEKVPEDIPIAFSQRVTRNMRK